MRLGFKIPKDMAKLPFEEVAKWASENGFSVIDTEVENADICRKYGLEVGCIRPRPNILTSDVKAREQAQEEFIRIIDQAAAKGIRRSMANHWRQPGMSTEESIEVFRKGWTPVAKHAEKYDFKLVMEICPHGGRGLASSPEMWRALLDAVPSPSMGLCLDPSHLVWQGIDYIRATEEFGDRIFFSHAKDTEILLDKRYEYGIMGKALGTSLQSTGWWRYRLPGYGEVNWARFITALMKVGYDDVIAVEHEDELWYGSPELNEKGLLLSKRVLAPYLI